MGSRIELQKLIIAANQNLKEREYWMNKFSERFIKSSFPHDGNGLKQDMAESEVRFSLPGELFSKLMAISKGADRKIHMILTAGVMALLEKYTNNKDILVGTSIYKQKIQGDFINTVLVLRNQIKEDESFKDILLNTRKTIFEAMENRNYPVEILVRQLDILYSPGDDFPLFDVAILLENIQDKNFIQSINCNVVFSFLRTAECIEGLITYNPARYYKTSIIRITHHFSRLMQGVLANADLTLSATSILSEEEKQWILFKFNNTDKEVVRDKSYHQIFEEVVLKKPGRIAAVYKHRQISYSELNEEADRLAYFLLEQGITSKSTVVLYLKRSINMLALIIGVYKAGGAYLPLEVDWPDSRIQYIIENSEANIVITDVEHYESLNSMQTSFSHPKNIRCLNHEGRLNTAVPSNTVKKQGKNSPKDTLAYIIYTSGTTGKPKGVMIHQLGMINHIYGKINDLSITEEDIIAQTASACFDVSVWQFLAGLLVGSRTFIIDKEIVLDFWQFLKVLQQGNITILESVPSLITTFLETAAQEDNNALNHLRWMILTGEPLGVPLAGTWYRHYPGIMLVNAYGPTEASDDVTHYFVKEFPPGHQMTIPIGKPLQNLHVYVLDKNLSLCPIGVRGEICVAGIGVGKGYWKDITKTENSFIPNPYLDDIQNSDYAILYKTGDIGYLREDENIECLGRMDDQVKIRGNRVELREIENLLLKHQDVKNAVVVIKDTGKPGDPGDEGENKKICAYVVADKDIDIARMREYLADELPDYMIPANFVFMDTIPLTSNGKIDRKALPTPETYRGSEYIAPRTELEEKLEDIWSDVLGLEKEEIGINANFFQLGGHSLKAVIMLSRVHKTLNVNIPLAKLFKSPTIKGLSRLIKKAGKDQYISIEPVEKKEYYALSSAQKRLYVSQQKEPQSTSLNLQQILVLEGELKWNKIAETFAKLIKRHESLRTSFHARAEELVQRVYGEVVFEIENHKMERKGENKQGAASKSDHGASIIESDPVYPGPDIYSKILKKFLRPFDLSHPPLLRTGIIEVENKKHLLMTDIHHIISDGVSYPILVQDFISLYTEKPLPELKLQYKDYAQWQNYLYHEEGEKVKKQETYWVNLFSGKIPQLNLEMMADYPHASDNGSDAGYVEFSLDEKLFKKIHSLSLHFQATIFMILLSIFNILLSKYTRQEDIIIGSTITGRNHADIERIIGMFVNMLALRNRPLGGKSVGEFLSEVKENTMEALENEDYQFDRLILKLGLQGSTKKNPLFETVFNMLNIDNRIDGNQDEMGDLKVYPYIFEKSQTQFNLILSAKEMKEKLEMLFTFNKGLFKKNTIEKMASDYIEIAQQIAADYDIKLADVKLSHELSTLKANPLRNDKNGFDF